MPRDTLSGAGKARKPCNKWDREQRNVLHVLYSSFNFDAATRTAVFNEIFKEHLRSCGFPNGLRNSVLYIQYAERLKPSRPECNAICAGPSTDAEWQYRHQLTRRIQTVAATLGGERQPPAAALQRARSTGRVDRPAIPSATTSRTAVKRRADVETDDELPCSPGNKRSRVAVSVTIENDEEELSGPLARTLVRRSSNAPVTPSRPRASLTLPTVEVATPSSSRSKKTPRPEATIEVVRRNGPALVLTPQQHAKILEPPVPVPETLAHPPASGLLFRYWDEHSYGENSGTGFLAGYFVQNNINEPAPKSTQLRFTELENHFNRNKIPSVFVSVSNCLLWILRLALTERAGNARSGAKKDKVPAKHGRITLINPAALDPKSYYYARAFHPQLRRTKCFTNGAWRYPGTHEFLIWREVPQRAILHTFALSDLIAECDRGSLKKTILGDLEENQIVLGPSATGAIARLCRFVGLNVESPLNVLEHIVMDVVQGWRLTIRHKSGVEWAGLAAIFVRVLCGHNTLPAPELEKKLNMTFLYGVRAGLSDFNTLHSQKSMDDMKHLAQGVGLASPTKIILDSLASATAAVLAVEKEQEARYAEASAAAANKLLPGFQDYFQLESDVNSSIAGPSGTADRDEDGDEIMYDDDLMGL